MIHGFEQEQLNFNRSGYVFLKPITKQKFKQNQRKELTKSRKKRNKQF